MDFEAEITRLFEGRWQVLDASRIESQGLQFPGVYAICLSADLDEGDPIQPEQVIYIGMSNARGGLRARLNQFRKAVEDGRSPHSGGRRLFREVLDGTPYSHPNRAERLLFTCQAYPCDVNKETRRPEDLRTMGYVACLELHLLAFIKELCGREPPLNEK